MSGLRERKKREAKAALERAALKLFAEKGYTGTTVDDIAMEANMSRSTFFRYFGSKEAVFFNVYEESGNKLLEALSKRPRGEPLLVSLEQALCEMADGAGRRNARSMYRDRQRFLESDPEMMARSRQLSEHWERRIAQTLAERDGLGVPGAEHRLAALVGVAVSRSVGLDWQERSEEITPDALLREHFATLRAMASEAADR